MQSTVPEDQRDHARLRSRKCERHRASLELIFWCATAKNPTSNLRYSSLEQGEKKDWARFTYIIHVFNLFDWILAIHPDRMEDHLWRPFAWRCQPERSSASPICAVVRLVHCAKAKPIIPAAQMPTGMPSIPLSQNEKSKSKRRELAPAA